MAEYREISENPPEWVVAVYPAEEEPEVAAASTHLVAVQRANRPKKRLTTKDGSEVKRWLESTRLHDREAFLVLLFTIAPKKPVIFLGVYIAALHDPTATPVSVPQILRVILAMKANGVIVSHNHPSGSNRPSVDDVAMTERLEKALKIFGVKLIDHIIIGEDNHFSFSEANMIDGKR